MAIARRKPLAAKIGILSVGHHTYWGQFPGLLDEMNRKTKVLVEKVKGNGAEVVDFGMVDNAETAYAALPKVRAAGLDLLMIDMVTYATSSTFGVLARAPCWTPPPYSTTWLCRCGRRRRRRSTGTTRRR